MIVAHHNRIEQLRGSFKKKTEEADAWPVKVQSLVLFISMYFTACGWCSDSWALYHIYLDHDN